MQPNVVFEEVIQIIKQYVTIFNEDINQINTQIAENNKGIYIYFGDLNARSCIRIYPAESNNKYKYACGHTLVELDWESLRNRFYKDFHTIKNNMKNGRITRPIDQLIKEQQSGQFKARRIQEDQQKQLAKQMRELEAKEEARLALEEEQRIINLPDQEFSTLLKEKTSVVINNIKEKEILLQKQQDTQHHLELQKFFSYVLKNMRKDMLVRAKEGLNYLTYNHAKIKDFNFNLSGIQSKGILEEIETVDSFTQFKKSIENFGIQYELKIHRDPQLELIIKW